MLLALMAIWTPFWGAGQWDIDTLDPEGKIIPKSPDDIVIQIFNWIGIEGRTTFWIARKLNEVEMKAPGGDEWSPSKVYRIVYNRCYTGKHTYNANARVPNPRKSLGDVTGAVKRTLLRPKQAEEAVTFDVPQLCF